LGRWSSKGREILEEKEGNEGARKAREELGERMMEKRIQGGRMGYSKSRYEIDIP
jgi:hypothetical protein